MATLTFFGDGSLHMLKTPGHTPGESSLHVRLPNRSILLVGDTLHLREQFNTLSGMPLDTDPRGLVVVHPTPAGHSGPARVYGLDLARPGRLG